MKLVSSEMLELRPDGRGIFFVGTRRPSIVEVGDGVTLKSAGVTILCEVEAVDPNGVIVGRIAGFEQVPDVTFKDMAVDDKITFKELHVIGCSKRNAVGPK